jgi:hypothetical protein
MESDCYWWVYSFLLVLDYSSDINLCSRWVWLQFITSIKNIVDGQWKGHGTASSKQQAKEEAAKEALAALKW